MSARTAPNQDEIDARNAAFWDELCGSQLARELGITDNSPASLKKFDDWYFDFYPYLYDHIPFAELKGKRVLEVGLGYGTVSQKIAESGAHYHGLDIAAGPVAMAAHRCEFVGAKDAVVQQGSILEPPFDDRSFDWVVAIGCLHHTGDLQGAIDQVYRLLKRGGDSMIMVYSAASYRQWMSAPVTTIKRLLADPNRYIERKTSRENMRGAYDTSLEGEAAPQTEFVSKAELAHMCRDFGTCQITVENIGAEGPLRFLDRPTACRLFGRYLGLDLYCHVQK